METVLNLTDHFVAQFRSLEAECDRLRAGQAVVVAAPSDDSELKTARSDLAAAHNELSRLRVEVKSLRAGMEAVNPQLLAEQAERAAVQRQLNQAQQELAAATHRRAEAEQGFRDRIAQLERDLAAAKIGPAQASSHSPLGGPNRFDEAAILRKKCHDLQQFVDSLPPNWRDELDNVANLQEQVRELGERNRDLKGEVHRLQRVIYGGPPKR